MAIKPDIFEVLSLYSTGTSSHSFTITPHSHCAVEFYVISRDNDTENRGSKGVNEIHTPPASAVPVFKSDLKLALGSLIVLISSTSAFTCFWSLRTRSHPVVGKLPSGEFQHRDLILMREFHKPRGLPFQVHMGNYNVKQPMASPWQDS